MHLSSFTIVKTLIDIWERACNHRTTSSKRACNHRTTSSKRELATIEPLAPRVCGFLSFYNFKGLSLFSLFTILFHTFKKRKKPEMWNEIQFIIAIALSFFRKHINLNVQYHKNSQKKCLRENSAIFAWK